MLIECIVSEIFNISQQDNLKLYDFENRGTRKAGEVLTLINILLT